MGPSARFVSSPSDASVMSSPNPHSHKDASNHGGAGGEKGASAAASRASSAAGSASKSKKKKKSGAGNTAGGGGGGGGAATPVDKRSRKPSISKDQGKKRHVLVDQEARLRAALIWRTYLLFPLLVLRNGTMVENSQDYRLKYWATRSSVRSWDTE